MTDFPPPSLALDATTLLSHSAWLAKFARALVANEADIDDVVQQTLATALARPPRHTGNLRGWLGTVAKNVVRSSARSDTARAAREVALPPPPPVESPVEAVARAELRRKVVECVLALDEPYRSTVILRFFEEQEVRAIARLTQTGEDTVRTRLRRGVLRVRELLERRVDEETRGTAHEGVAARALLLSRLRDIAASADRPSIAGGGGAHGSSAVSRGFGRTAAVQTTRRVLVGAAVVAATGAGWWWETSDRASRSTEAASSRRDPPSVAPATRDPIESAPAAAAERATAPAPAPALPPAKPDIVKLGTIRGVVTDPDGKPITGAHVWAISTASQKSNGTTPEFAQLAKKELDREATGHGLDNWIGTLSGEGGRYEITGLPTLPGWEIGAFDGGIGSVVTDVQSIRRGREEITVDLKLARGVNLHGNSVDESGAPLGNARITVFRTYRGVESPLNLMSGAYGARLGHYEAGFVCGDSLEAECTAPGFVGSPRSRIEIRPDASDVALDFTLKRRPGSVVRGRIVDPSGAPLKLEALLQKRFAAVSPISRVARVSVRAIPSTSSSVAEAGVDAMEEGSVLGRVDFVQGMYDVVLDHGFRGTLELRIERAVVGSAPLTDLEHPPDLPCDAERIPKEAASTRFALRFVDAESREAIDLGTQPYPPQLTEGSWIQSSTMPDDDLRHGIAHYGCKPGNVRVRVIISPDFAAGLYPIVVPEAEPKEPITLEVPRARAGIRGTVLHADGRPFARSFVSVYRVTPGGLIDASAMNLATNDDGEFQFNSLAQGEHVVVASGTPDEAPGVLRVVAEAPFTPVEIHTVAGQATRFRILAEASSEDSPVTQYRIEDGDGVVVDDPHRNWSTSSGTFDELSATLRSGRYVLVVERRGYRARRLEFDVPAGDTMTVALEPLEPRSK
jgi:RNA polymerase sigma-70 factor (ECF subfamily)